MLRTCCLLLFALLFQGCVMSMMKCHTANTLNIWGAIDGDRELIEKYKLVYIVGGDTAHLKKTKKYRDDDPSIHDSFKKYSRGYRNIWVRLSEMNCGYPLRGKNDVEIFLVDRISRKSTLLEKKKIDMDEFPSVLVLTQVYFGNNRSLYKKRGYNNIDWGEMKQIVLENTNDTLYHHTAKYISYDVNERYSENMTEVIGD